MQIKSPASITEATLQIADAKSRLPFMRLLALSVMAGAFIALGGLLSLIAGYGFPEITASNPSLQRLLSGATFPLGLILVVVMGAELFTGNNAILIPACMKGRLSVGSVLRNWGIVWVGNFIGALLFIAVFVAATGIIAPSSPYGQSAIAIAQTKVSLPWLTIFFRGIGANWCVCLALWLALAGHSLTEKIAACWFPVMAFVAIGFEHSIANMFFIPTGMVLGADVSIWQLIVDNLLPSTLGNIVGGALFVGCAFGWVHLKN